MVVVLGTSRQEVGVYNIRNQSMPAAISAGGARTPSTRGRKSWMLAWEGATPGVYFSFSLDGSATRTTNAQR